MPPSTVRRGEVLLVVSFNGSARIKKKGRRLQCSDTEITRVGHIIGCVALRHWIKSERGRVSRITAELRAASETEKGTSGHLWGFQPGHQADAG